MFFSEHSLIVICSFKVFKINVFTSSLYDISFFKNDYKKQINNISNIYYNNKLKLSINTKDTSFHNTPNASSLNQTNLFHQRRSSNSMYHSNDNNLDKKVLTTDFEFVLFSSEKELFISKNGFYEKQMDVVSESLLNFNNEIIDLKVSADGSFIYKQLLIFLFAL